MTERVSLTTDIALSGPFFTRDPGKTLRGNVRDMMDALAADLEADVRSEIRAHITLLPWYAVGRTVSRSGKRWGTWARIAPLNEGLTPAEAIEGFAKLAGRHDGTGSDARNRGTTRGLEPQYHPFRKAKSKVYRSRALLTADLTRRLE